ncbi:MAG: aromatic-ring-hydroxylating dioxygenase subunit beta [Bacillota bacterium]|nr:aromatic-ring-hydroxylating dioxygenase subunit beta [Bacillota bacterium]
MAGDFSPLLYREARLLDEGRFEEWLSLFTGDAIYWVPGDNAEDPMAASIIYDDRPTMEDRVRRLRSPLAFSQSPPSLTLHQVSNVEVLEEEEDRAEVACAYVIHENRLGLSRVFAARAYFSLRKEEGTWKIARKKVVLLQRQDPLYNLTFLL